MGVTVQAKLVVGCWEVIPLESGADSSVEEDTAIDPKENGDQGDEEKKPAQSQRRKGEERP